MSLATRNGGALLAIVLLVGIAAGRTAADERPRVPVLVELFTSQGCSSCPPADALLRELRRTQPIEGAFVIGLSEHVDYWNDLGWVDPFSSRAFSDRQRGYSRRFELRGVYTPQLVIDGRAQLVGNRRGEVIARIREAARTPKGIVELTARPTGGDGEIVELVVEVRGLTTLEAAELWLAVTENERVTTVDRGENSGKDLVHAGVVRELRRVDRIPAGAGRIDTTVSVHPSPGSRRESLQAVVFVQARRRGPILAVGHTALPSD